MDITSYLLGKKAGGGSPTPPSLQEKNVTITENTTTNVLPDIGYDGLSKVSVTTNVAGGGGDLDWSAIGYDSTPESIVDGYNYAKYIQENWDTLKNNTFSNDVKLRYFPLVDMSTLNANRMQYYFSGCSSLSDIASINIMGKTTLFSFFSNCNSLKNIPLLDTSSVTNMNSTFNGCSSLTTIPLLNTSSVTIMNNMFQGCPSLTDGSLDNILQMCINATSYTGTKTLYTIGLRSNIYPVTRIEVLPHYQDFIDAGWTIGY